MRSWLTATKRAGARVPLDGCCEPRHNRSDAGAEPLRPLPDVTMELLLTAPLATQPPWVLRRLWPLLGALLILRLLVNLRPTLAPDEAVYWAWSRHLALSYFDHPPMIAWLNWLTTRLLGSTEFAVRLHASIMAVGIVAIVASLAARVIPNPAAAGWVAIIWLVSPLVTGWATIATPDTPTIFFSTAALACAALICLGDDEANRQHEPLLWLLFGALTGLALLSKYTAIALPVATAAAFVSSSAGRRHLARPWPYLSMLLALAIFSPVLWWNYRHGWASFAFQLHHGVSDDAAPPLSFAGRLVSVARNLSLYVGGQFIIWTPILFILGMIVLAQQWRSISQISNVDRLLLLNATVPLVLFGVASARRLGELNWPVFAYIPLSIMTGRWLARTDSVRRAKVVGEGCKLALAFTVVIHIVLIPGFPRLLGWFHIPLPRPARELLQNDRRDFGRALARAANGAMIVCNRHQDAAEAAFYTPGQPDVWCDGVGFRPTAWDFFDEQPDFSKIDRVLFVGGHSDKFRMKHGYTTARIVDISTPITETENPRTAVLVSR